MVELIKPLVVIGAIGLFLAGGMPTLLLATSLGGYWVYERASADGARRPRR